MKKRRIFWSNCIINSFVFCNNWPGYFFRHFSCRTCIVWNL